MRWLVDKQILDDILFTRRQLYANQQAKHDLTDLLQTPTWEMDLCSFFQRYNFSEPGQIRRYLDEELILEAEEEEAPSASTTLKQLSSLIEECVSCQKKTAGFCPTHSKLLQHLIKQ